MTDKANNLTSRTADSIFHMITDAPGFAPGAQLPAENELCKITGVSRTTVRAAIAMLANQGFVEVRRGVGTFVAQTAVLQQDIGFGALNAAKVRLKDLFEMRMMFEPDTAAFACARCTDEDMERISRCAERVEELVKRGEDWAAADVDYHQAIVSASHNQFMEQLGPIINRACTEAWMMRSVGRELPERVIEDNRMFMDFLKKRDAHGCKYAMAVHICHVAGLLGLESMSFDML